MSSAGGGYLIHTAGELFRSRGVKPGDFVYVVTVLSGKLFLCGRMEVELILTQKEADEHFGRGVWQGTEHLLTSPEKATRRHFDLRVSLRTTEELQFETKQGPKPPYFKSHDVLDEQTFRGVRKLTRKAAELLDSLLLETAEEAEIEERVENEEEPEVAAFEGEERQYFIKHRSRERKLRDAKVKAVLKAKGNISCEVPGCGFDFFKTYGEPGREYVQVHHLLPLGKRGGASAVTPMSELVLVCANCHVMIHNKGRNRPYQFLIHQLTYQPKHKITVHKDKKNPFEEGDKDYDFINYIIRKNEYQINMKDLRDMIDKHYEIPETEYEINEVVIDYIYVLMELNLITCDPTK